MKVYFIPGLGADSRAFNFLDLSFCEPIFIEWPAPSPRDNIEAYAEKIFDLIKDETATIVGLSFGGMIATEIAKQHPQTNAILISSAKTYKEIPAYLRFWKHVPLYNYFSGGTLKFSGKMVLKILGAKGADQQKLQQEIIKSSDPAFTRWAMHAIVNWRNNMVPENITHIHGTADKLLPFRYVISNYTIEGGEHVMIMDRAKEVSELLQKLCNK